MATASRSPRAAIAARPRVGGGNEAHVGLEGLGAAEALVLAVLQAKRGDAKRGKARRGGSEVT